MPVETTVSESYRQDLVDTGVVIRTEGLAKVYHADRLVKELAQ